MHYFGDFGDPQAKYNHLFWLGLAGKRRLHDRTVPARTRRFGVCILRLRAGP